VLAGLGWSPAPKQGSGRSREQWESWTALADLAEEYAATHPGAGLAEFVHELDERKAVQHAPAVDGVTLASLHSAKGLEWDAVALVGLTEGLLPISYAETPDQIEEERRLLYVGVTRARAGLSLSWALSRAPGGRSSRRPSRFLDRMKEVQEARSDDSAGGVVRRGSGRSGEDGRKQKRAGPVRCRVCGRSLIEPVERKLGRCADCPADIDEALFERLREWRSASAREQSLPAYVVFTDATLTAIAEARPADRAQLAAIPGVGAAKLNRYGAEVLALTSGAAAAESVLAESVLAESVPPDSEPTESEAVEDGGAGDAEPS
jgi:DNA helicase-2/ATP-dependent DNA helicase PcrA